MPPERLLPSAKKNNPVGKLRANKSLKDVERLVPDPKTSTRYQHGIVLSLSSSDCDSGNETLERCFKELVSYYRHSSVGQRCLGIVHQMNTPLQVLSFQLDLLEQKVREEKELLSESAVDLEKLITLSHYRVEKFRQLRHELEKLQDFSRRLTQQGAHEEAADRVNLDLNQLCQQELALYLAEPIFKHQIAKEFRFADEPALIQGHYIDFSQSFRNLIDNALEAMAGLEHRGLTVITACQDRRFTVSIGDSGIGIAPEQLPRIFDPFFTTKDTPERPRAGLGLFLVRRLLAAYEGEIRVDSRPGETWVTVTIPLL
jgi:two-component system, NtrC family, sensor kinase